MKKIVILFQVIFLGIYFHPLRGQVVATGHVSAEIVEMDNLHFTPDLNLVSASTGSDSQQLQPDKSFFIGEVKFTQKSETNYNFTVKPFPFTNTDGKKMVIVPYWDSPYPGTESEESILKLKAKVFSLPEADEQASMNFCDITLNYN